MEKTVVDILLIDDNPDFFHVLKYAASRENVVLQYARTLEEGMDALYGSNRIAAVILDGKGLTRKDDEDGAGHLSFLTNALSALSVFENKVGRSIPRAVLTAWPLKVREMISEDIDVYDKATVAKSNMFLQLIRQVRDSQSYRIRNRYALQLSWFDHDYFPVGYEPLFFRLLQDVEEEQGAIDGFNSMRKIIEESTKQLRLKRPDLLPDPLFRPDGIPILKRCDRYFNGQEINEAQGQIILSGLGGKNTRIPYAAAKGFSFVLDRGNNLSHEVKTDAAKYLMRACLYALFAYLDWYVDAIRGSNES